MRGSGMRGRARSKRVRACTRIAFAPLRSFKVVLTCKQVRSVTRVDDTEASSRAKEDREGADRGGEEAETLGTRCTFNEGREDARV
eukprot:1804183-Pleurochrysis_carterae.AAC.3